MGVLKIIPLDVGAKFVSLLFLKYGPNISEANVKKIPVHHNVLVSMMPLKPK